MAKKKSKQFFPKELHADVRGSSFQILKPLKKKSIDRYGNTVIVEFSRQVVMFEWLTTPDLELLWASTADDLSARAS